MKRRDFIALVGTVAIGWALPARAEPPPKTYRLGYLGAARFPNLIEALQTVLRELGYVEGKNDLVETSSKRWASLLRSSQRSVPTRSSRLQRLRL